MRRPAPTGSHHALSWKWRDAQLATKVFEPAPGRVQPFSFASSHRPVPPDLERWRKASWFSESERWYADAYSDTRRWSEVERVRRSCAEVP